MWDPESFFEASAYEEAQRSGWHNVKKKSNIVRKKNNVEYYAILKWYYFTLRNNVMLIYSSHIGSARVWSCAKQDF